MFSDQNKHLSTIQLITYDKRGNERATLSLNTLCLMFHTLQLGFLSRDFSFPISRKSEKISIPYFLRKKSNPGIIFNIYHHINEK